jgi:hypothetical protein
MARYTFTLTLDDLTIVASPPPDQFLRSIVQKSELTFDGLSPNNTPLFSGETSPNWDRRYQWVVSVEVTEMDALIIEAMLREQTENNLIELKDEYEYLELQTGQQKPMISGSEVTIGTRTTGFFQGNVWMSVGEAHKTHLGAVGCDPTMDDIYKKVEFTLTEIP